jgi:inner membrane protein involved in colicin E2 resistance
MEKLSKTAILVGAASVTIIELSKNNPKAKKAVFYSLGLIGVGYLAFIISEIKKLK